MGESYRESASDAANAGYLPVTTSPRARHSAITFGAYAGSTHRAHRARRGTEGDAIMDGYVVHGSIGMTRGSVLRIEDGRGVLVYAWEGHLWLTQQHDRRDHFLAAGEWFTLDRDGVALVHATGRSVVTLTAPTQALYARRITLALAGTRTPQVIYDAARERMPLAARLRLQFERWRMGAYAPNANGTSAAL
jgi:hypothetical protein